MARWSTAHYKNTWNMVCIQIHGIWYVYKSIGVARGGPGVPVTPLCKPSCKQTTYNIQVTIWWVPSVWVSVTPPPPLKNPGYAHETRKCEPINYFPPNLFSLTRYWVCFFFFIFFFGLIDLIYSVCVTFFSNVANKLQVVVVALHTYRQLALSQFWRQFWPEVRILVPRARAPFDQGNLGAMDVIFRRFDTLRPAWLHRVTSSQIELTDQLATHQRHYVGKWSV